jgi:hypothetical protein
MSATITRLDAIKRRQQRMWASGEDAAVAARIHPMAQRLCEAADLVAGTRVLGVATFLVPAGTKEFLSPAPQPKGCHA